MDLLLGSAERSGRRKLKLPPLPPPRHQRNHLRLWHLRRCFVCATLYADQGTWAPIGSAFGIERDDPWLFKLPQDVIPSTYGKNIVLNNSLWF